MKFENLQMFDQEYYASDRRTLSSIHTRREQLAAAGVLHNVMLADAILRRLSLGISTAFGVTDKGGLQNGVPNPNANPPASCTHYKWRAKNQYNFLNPEARTQAPHMLGSKQRPDPEDGHWHCIEDAKGYTRERYPSTVTLKSSFSTFKSSESEKSGSKDEEKGKGAAPHEEFLAPPSIYVTPPTPIYLPDREPAQEEGQAGVMVSESPSGSICGVGRDKGKRKATSSVVGSETSQPPRARLKRHHTEGHRSTAPTNVGAHDTYSYSNQGAFVASGYQLAPSPPANPQPSNVRAELRSEFSGVYPRICTCQGSRYCFNRGTNCDSAVNPNGQCTACVRRGCPVAYVQTSSVSSAATVMAKSNAAAAAAADPASNRGNADKRCFCYANQSTKCRGYDSQTGNRYGCKGDAVLKDQCLWCEKQDCPSAVTMQVVPLDNITDTNNCACVVRAWEDCLAGGKHCGKSREEGSASCIKCLKKGCPKTRERRTVYTPLPPADDPFNWTSTGKCYCRKPQDDGTEVMRETCKAPGRCNGKRQERTQPPIIKYVPDDDGPSSADPKQKQVQKTKFVTGDNWDVLCKPCAKAGCFSKKVAQKPNLNVPEGYQAPQGDYYQGNLAKARADDGLIVKSKHREHKDKKGKSDRKRH
ncbi:hypothetical protein QBC43DRAFT_293850 [Cladorrhinum sp. PSN259]|nr:hypothetical protein QBC43DRAFT_293850 [Cladorrhinum sp. PSN259]